MTEREFEVMDHMYFVVSYKELLELTGLENKTLSEVLWGFIDHGMAKCLKSPEEEIQISKSTFDENCNEYYYLASKSGLLEHNLR